MIEGAAGYGDLCSRLTGWAMTSAAACPWKPVLAELPGWRPLLAALPGASVGALPELESWATCISSALVHRQRLSADEVEILAAPYTIDLPELASVLNAPLPAVP